MPRKERLSARPIERIAFEGRIGWLYLWNNGDTQMLWLDRHSSPAVAAHARKPHRTFTRRDGSQSE